MAISISGSSSQSQNSGANQSTVTGNGSMTLTVGSWSGLQSHGTVNIGGNGYDILGPTAMSQGGSWGWSASTTFNHDVNGYRGAVGVSVGHYIDGTTLHRGSADAGTQGALDYFRAPSAPGVPSLSRTGDGTSITITSQVASSAATVTDYNYRWSTDNSSWSGAVAMGTGRVATHSGLTNTQDYYYQTRAYADGGWGDWSGSTGINGVPTVPTSVVGTASTSVSGRITVTWTTPADTNGGITNYYVYRDGTYIGNTGGTGTSYVDDGRTKGTNYSYYVVAYNAIGYSSNSSASTATQAPGVPYAATLNSITPSTDTFGKVTLSWSDPATAVGTIQNYYMYAVYGGVIQKTVATASATTSGDITGLDERKVYTFYVRARNQFSIDNSTPGDQSNTIDKKSPGPPTAPQSLTSTAPYSPPGTIDLSWTAPSDVGTEGGTITGYSVYLAGSSTPTKTTIGTGTTTTITDLTPATSYTFNVKARNAIADTVGTFSVASNSTTATAQGEPFAPTGLTVVSDPVVSGRLIITWVPPVGYNTGFRVYTGAGTLIANIATPRLVIDGLTPNTSYSYKVRARNPLTDITNSDGGPFSDTVAGTVGSSSVQTLAATSITNVTNSSLVGTYAIAGTTSTTLSYNKVASNIASATVPVGAGSLANNTNTNLNGTYTISVPGGPTSSSFTFSRAGSDIAANTSTPSGTITNNTNAIFNGSYTVAALPAPDSVAKTVSYARTSSDVSLRAVSGTITNNSNTVYNGVHTLDSVTETTMTYAKTHADLAETLAFGTVYNKTNNDVFNGTYAIADTPDHKTISYVTGDLIYAENLITNPSMEAVNSGTTIIRTNLISNPSFESNVTGWTTTSSAIARNATHSVAGTYSGLVTPGSTTGGVSVAATTVSGTTYTFSFYAYSDEPISLTVVSGATTQTFSVAADQWNRFSLAIVASSTSTTIAINATGSTQPFYLDNVLFETGSYLQPYFDGATTAARGYTYAWTGTAHASTSTVKAQSTIAGAQTGATLTLHNGTFANIVASPVVKHSGDQSAYVVPSTTTGGLSTAITTVSGTAYMYSVWVYTTVGKNMKVTGNGVSGTVTAVPANTWTRLNVAFTASSSSTVLTVVGTDSTQPFYVDDTMLQATTVLQTYFDGDTDANTVTWPVVYTWFGTEHASISIREVGATLPTIGSALLSPYGLASRVTSEATLQIQYRSGWLG